MTAVAPPPGSPPPASLVPAGESGAPTGESAPLAYQPRRLGTRPRGDLIRGTMAEYGKDPIGTMVRWRDEHGDLVPIRFGPFKAFMAFGPAEISDVLVEHARDYRKSLGTRLLIPLLGDGLLTNEGDDWLRQRRLASPAFHRARVATYAETMVRFAEEHVARWRDGQELDIHAEMTELTLRIVAKVLFDADVTTRIEEVARLGAAIQDHYFDRLNSIRFLLPHWLPTPGNRRLGRTIRRLDEIVYELIRERDRDEDRGDLMSMLLLARDEHGQRMSDRQVRDEVLTLLLAGHETTALALTWAWTLLDGRPEARERLAEELDSVLGGRSPTPEDVPALRYTEAGVYESLRLYPPAYATGREAIRDTMVVGTPVPKGRVVFMSMHATHRDPRFYEEPDSFRPERWLDGLERRLPRGAFFPFGLGPRKCIGASFAMLEATLLLATIAQRWRFELRDRNVPAKPAITLRPVNGVVVTASRA